MGGSAVIDIIHLLKCYSLFHSLKATVENPRGSVEKLSPKENVEVLQPRVCPRKIPREPSHCPAAQCRHPRDSPEGTVFQHCPEDFQQLLRLSKS